MEEIDNHYLDLHFNPLNKDNNIVININHNKNNNNNNNQFEITILDNWIIF